MNEFLTRFATGIATFFDAGTEEERKLFLAGILQYANADPQKFKHEIKDISFDDINLSWSVIMEALSADTTQWGDLFVEIVDDIFIQAKLSQTPGRILDVLADLAYIDEVEARFNQKIVDRLMGYINDEAPAIKMAAIKALPDYLENPSIKNKQLIIAALRDQLNHPYWKVRCVAHSSLRYGNLLPPGQKLSLIDKLRSKIFGDPMFYQ